MKLMPPTELGTGEDPSFQPNEPDPVLSTRKYCPGDNVRLTGNVTVVPDGREKEKVAIAVLTVDPRSFVRSSRGVQGQDTAVSPRSSTSFRVTVVPTVKA
jgi:starvation-inducible outer membrane lipoprotein